MTDELKTVRCGCGGEATTGTIFYEGAVRYGIKQQYYAECQNCKTRTFRYATEAEAVTAWNTAMGATDNNVGDKERTAKVERITAKNGHSWIECSRCHQEVAKGFPYCAGCGAKLDWSGVSDERQRIYER